MKNKPRFCLLQSPLEKMAAKDSLRPRPIAPSTNISNWKYRQWNTLQQDQVLKKKEEEKKKKKKKKKKRQTSDFFSIFLSEKRRKMIRTNEKTSLLRLLFRRTELEGR